MSIVAQLVTRPLPVQRAPVQIRVATNFSIFVFYFEAKDSMFCKSALILHNMLISCVINENKTEKLKGEKSSQWKIRTYDIKI